jgi:hypothetical protein
MAPPRRWYRCVGRLRRSGGGVEGAVLLAQLTCAAGPLLRLDFVLLDDGRLALTSPRAIYSWLTDGWYYRLLDLAIQKGQRDAFTTFVGYLFENICARALPSSALEPRSPERESARRAKLRWRPDDLRRGF